MAESTKSKAYRINILDPDALQAHVEQFADILHDMRDTNPNIRPIKWQTKDRWVGDLETIYSYFARFVRKENSTPSTDEDETE